jgi:MFS family permease
MTGLRRALVAMAAGLALADASIVALALPPILAEMDTTITGVAAIVGVYALVLALAIWPASRLRAGSWGFALFAAASLACGLAGSLAVLLVFRALQAAGGAAALLAAFSVLDAGTSRTGRRLWLGAALVGTAAGPAIGGALTEAFDWRAIFIVQAPLAAAAAIACRQRAHAVPRAGVPPAPDEPKTAGGLWSQRQGPPVAAPPRVAPAGFARVPGAAALRAVSPVWLASLAFTAAAFTAVLFLLVIELVAGFAMSPIRAALGVTVLPLAALGGAAVRGEPKPKALAGAVLIAGGAAALAFLPAATIAWAVVPQLLAGTGMGLALPAYSDERTVAEAARHLVARHAGIVVVLAILAPVATAKLASATDRAILQGASLVLDAQIDPLQKLRLAPALLDDVDVDSPRAGLRRAVERRRAEFADDAVVYDRLAGRLDDVVVVAVQDAFRTAYLIAAPLALLAVALLSTAWRRPAVWLATAAAAAAVVVYVVERNAEAPAPVVLQNPCLERRLPAAGGVSGALQNEALRLLDRAACEIGTSREELALALFDPERAKEFEREHGVDPRSVGGLLSLLGG